MEIGKPLSPPALEAVAGQYGQIMEAMSELGRAFDPNNPESQRQVQARLAAGFRALKGEAMPAEARLTWNPRQERDDFIVKYRIVCTAYQSVSFTIPIGGSCLTLLQDAQDLAAKFCPRSVINPGLLTDLTANDASNAVSSRAIDLYIESSVADSKQRSRSYLSQQNLRMPELWELAAAHAACFAATGLDLFDGNIMRAKEGALYFPQGGLDRYVHDGGGPSPCIAASVLLSRKERGKAYLPCWIFGPTERRSFGRLGRK